MQTTSNSDMLEALRRSERWLAKMVADGSHKNAVAPTDCEATLRLVSNILKTNR